MVIVRFEPWKTRIPARELLMMERTFHQWFCFRMLLLSKMQFVLFAFLLLSSPVDQANSHTWGREGASLSSVYIQCDALLVLFCTCIWIRSWRMLKYWFSLSYTIYLWSTIFITYFHSVPFCSFLELITRVFFHVTCMCICVRERDYDYKYVSMNVRMRTRYPVFCFMYITRCWTLLLFRCTYVGDT